MDKVLLDLEKLNDGQETFFDYKGCRYIFTKVIPEDNEFPGPCFVMDIIHADDRGDWHEPTILH